MRPLVDPLKLPSPAYSAEIMFDPGVNVVGLKLAIAPTSETGLPIAIPFVRNCTMPVGMAAAGEIGPTVAMKVTLENCIAGLSEEAASRLEEALVISRMPCSKVNS